MDICGDLQQEPSAVPSIHLLFLIVGFHSRAKEAPNGTHDFAHLRLSIWAFSARKRSGQARLPGLRPAAWADALLRPQASSREGLSARPPVEVAEINQTPETSVAARSMDYKHPALSKGVVCCQPWKAPHISEVHSNREHELTGELFLILNTGQMSCMCLGGQNAPTDFSARPIQPCTKHDCCLRT